MRAAVEATMLGGKGLTAPLARRKNDAGGGWSRFSLTWLGNRRVMCRERARCAIDWKEGASKKRMTNDRKRAKEGEEGMRFAAQIVGRCGFAAWGLCGGSFSMYVRVETRAYAHGLALGVDSGALCECAARERCGRRLKPPCWAASGDTFHCADCQAVRFRGVGFARRFIFDVRKSENVGLCAWFGAGC